MAVSAGEGKVSEICLLAVSFCRMGVLLMGMIFVDLRNIIFFYKQNEE